MAEEILYEHRGRVVIITINRPESRNAINIGVREGLFAAWGRFEKDTAARAAILTGAGDKAFCAGADLKEMSHKKLGVLPRNFMPTLNMNVHVTKPVIAAVNGVAYAGGWALVQMCDIVMASETARFAITEAKVGRGMPWAVPLTHLIPQKVLLEILMTGDPVSAQRAYEIGLCESCRSCGPAHAQSAGDRRSHCRECTPHRRCGQRDGVYGNRYGPPSQA